MNWFKSILSGIGRAFTLPRATRVQLDRNPAVQAGLQVVAPLVAQSVNAAITANVKDPAAAAVISEAVAASLSHVFPAAEAGS